MDKLLILAYIACGGIANAYLRHNLFGIQTVYVFNMKNFLLDKIAWAFIFGWLSIPVALIHWAYTRNSKITD